MKTQITNILYDQPFDIEGGQCAGHGLGFGGGEAMSKPLNREDVEKVVADARAKDERPDLRDANLRGMDLSMANLSDVDLHGADLSGADLSGADLSMAGLRMANLSDADLSGADLNWADLRLAILRGADLSGADLSDVDLHGALGLFSVANLGRHDAIAAGGYIAIGCERHTYDHWLEHAEEIGKANEYTDSEIERYMTWIESVVPWLKAEEAKR